MKSEKCSIFLLRIHLGILQDIFSGFSKKNLKIIDFSTFREFGTILVGFAGWKVVLGNLESFQKFRFEKFPFPLIFLCENYGTKLDRFHIL